MSRYAQLTRENLTLRCCNTALTQNNMLLKQQLVSAREELRVSRYKSTTLTHKQQEDLTKHSTRKLSSYVPIQNDFAHWLKNTSRVRFAWGAHTFLKDLARVFNCDVEESVKKLCRKTLFKVFPDVVLVNKKACKSCSSTMGKGCCACFSNTNRTTVYIVRNLQIVN